MKFKTIETLEAICYPRIPFPPFVRGFNRSVLTMAQSAAITQRVTEDLLTLQLPPPTLELLLVMQETSCRIIPADNLLPTSLAHDSLDTVAIINLSAPYLTELTCICWCPTSLVFPNLNDAYDKSKEVCWWIHAESSW